MAETVALENVEMDVGPTQGVRQVEPKKKVKTGRRVKQQRHELRDEALQASSDTGEYNAGSRVQGPRRNKVLEDKNQGLQKVQSA